MDEAFAIVIGAGTFRSDRSDSVAFPHRWTPEGVSVEAPFTGAHLLHVAVAGCVLNDLYREADALGLAIDGVRVTAEGGFDDGWRSTGIRYRVEVDSAAGPEDVAALVRRVDEVAEIPRAIRSGAQVGRDGHVRRAGAS